MSALTGSQQNFAISDPTLPDNPIVFVSQGFLELTGYTMSECLGRNCRFLQGPGTDQKAVEVIRRGIADGVDTSVCLLNYRADGSVRFRWDAIVDLGNCATLFSIRFLTCYLITVM